jgi:hypothetical protein
MIPEIRFPVKRKSGRAKNLKIFHRISVIYRDGPVHGKSAGSRGTHHFRQRVVNAG